MTCLLMVLFTFLTKHIMIVGGFFLQVLVFMSQITVHVEVVHRLFYRTLGVLVVEVFVFSTDIIILLKLFNPSYGVFFLEHGHLFN